LEAIIKIITDFKQLYNSYNEEYISNIELEYHIQKEIMLIALDLASNPYTSANEQRQRREFYEKSKKQVSKIEIKLRMERKSRNSTSPSSNNDNNSSQFNTTTTTPQIDPYQLISNEIIKVN
jgi:hypothetical protein